jgi:hypothetical protein
MTLTYDQSCAHIQHAIQAIQNGHMDAKWWNKNLCREWCAKLDPDACVHMASAIQHAMVHLHVNNRPNAGERMCTLLVYVVARSLCDEAYPS